ncbi:MULTISPECIES: ComEC/Rec2 family competence protein [Rothia]|uniref:Metallo-beta-lactamase domain-containing protein n=1 Tax=Rothia nasimurium TaxID=85336 RepID=A0A1Y1RQE4_9MICC|nr:MULTISPECIES: MBL fold metallo-hydrolase [Rothia]ORC22016.1 hypothetical protein A7979_00385 [Rothia nasimurium]
MRYQKLLRNLLLAAIGLLLVLLLAQRQAGSQLVAPTTWQWISCDVGQGDAHLIRTGPESAYLLDTGNNYSALTECLSWAGVRELDAIVLTHAHSDHDGAVQHISQRFPSAPVMTSAHYDGQLMGALQLSRDGNHRRIGGTEEQSSQQQGHSGPGHSGSPHGYPESADQESNTHGTVLWPPAEPQQVPGKTGSSSRINNTSLVIYWTVKPRGPGQRSLTVLSTGDLEADAAHRLLSLSAGDLEANVLKIAHHGSASSGTDLITATQPVLTLIPVGRDNPHGHPHHEITDYLAERQLTALRTDTHGHIAVTSGHQGLTVATSR